jgi:hypothetical protein
MYWDMRTSRDLLMILALGCVIAFLAWRLFPEAGPANRGSERAPSATEELQTDSPSASSPFARSRKFKLTRSATGEPSPRGPEPVALNRGPEVLDGFQGDVHPLLHGHTQLEVTAHWTKVGEGRDKLHTHLNSSVYAWFTQLQPARPQHTYTDQELSAFFPPTVGDVGQLWSLDLDKMAEILKQFHPHPLMHLVAPGRRAGPDGAFAILRAVSPSYLDIVFRIHAEFYLTPSEGRYKDVDAWYSPAYFSGRVFVNKNTGTVDHFRLALPTDKMLNVHLTVDGGRLGFTTQPHDIVRVERMELIGGEAELVNNISWQKALSVTEANARLAKVFYKSLEIDWTPFDQVLTHSRTRSRPIFALVSWGATDDQSC